MNADTIGESTIVDDGAGNISFASATTIDWTNTTSTGTQNFDAGYVGDYADNSTLNIGGDVTWEAASTQTYVAGATVGGDATYVDFDTTYDADSSVTYNGNTITHNGTTQNYAGDNTVNLPDGATITNNLDGDVNNNY